MRILALDLGRATGIAFGDARSDPICSTEFLAEPGGSQTPKFCQALYLTDRLIKLYRPNVVVIEKPIAAGPVGREARVQLAFGYRGCVFGVAHMKNIKAREYSVQDVRDYLIGERNLVSEKAKPRVFDLCRKVGWDVSDFEQSDAAAVWAYARHKLAGVSMTPGLFGHQTHG